MPLSDSSGATWVLGWAVVRSGEGVTEIFAGTAPLSDPPDWWDAYKKLDAEVPYDVPEYDVRYLFEGEEEIWGEDGEGKTSDVDTDDLAGGLIVGREPRVKAWVDAERWRLEREANPPPVRP